MNKEDLKKKQESIEKGEEEKDGNEQSDTIVPKKKKKVLGLIQNSSDDDDNDNLIVDSSISNPLSDDNARHLTFQLELVFVNRIIKMFYKDILSTLVSFDGHPRDKKLGSNKGKNE